MNRSYHNDLNKNYKKFTLKVEFFIILVVGRYYLLSMYNLKKKNYIKKIFFIIFYLCTLQVTVLVYRTHS